MASRWSNGWRSVLRSPAVRAAAGVAGGLGVLAIGGWVWARRGLETPVLVMGDSLAVGLGQALQRRLGAAAVAIEAVVGEAPFRTRELAAARLGRHPEARTVVIWTGANRVGGWEPEAIALEVDETRNAVRRAGRRAVVMALPSVPRFEGLEVPVNRAISGPIVQVPLEPAQIAGDGLHLTARGYDAVAGRL